jgi:outer membrane protein OmpA-like peptidoglycan-associated protein
MIRSGLMRALPILDPCHQPWETMRGDERSRHCPTCDRRVHDLSAGTEARARAVLALFGATGVCVRYETGVADAIRHATQEREPRHVGIALGLLAAAVATGCSPPASPPLAPAPPAMPVCVPAEAPPRTDITHAPQATADADGAGVPDAEDACPNAPGPRSDDKNRNGCPSMGVVVTHDIVIMAQPSRFAFSRSKVPPESGAILDEIAALLAQHPEIQKVTVTGHASSDEKDAVRLGRARAQAVIEALAARRVDRGRLVAESMGDQRPIAPNTSAEGRASNRRVEMRVEPSPSPAAPP